MEVGKQVILSFLEKALDKPKKNWDGLVEYEFNCPSVKCSRDQNKFNLFYNTNKNKFHCWKCGYKGSISDLLKKYGTSDDYDLVSAIVQDIRKDVKKEELKEQKKELTLPEGFESLIDGDKDNYHYKNAIKYLESRGIGEKEIKKFKLGYTIKGKYRFRIVVPSYGKDGRLNYYDCRSFYPNVQPTYKKPDKDTGVKKFDIIFNESNVSFYSPIYLVEGVFDMFPIFNCVPMLGKVINNVLLKKIIEYRTPVVLCLDEDAISDVIKLFDLLNGHGIDVYWCPIKDDLAKIYELEGKTGIIKTLSNIKKMNLVTIMHLKILEKTLKDADSFIDKKEFEREWELIQKAHGKNNTDTTREI